MAHAHRWLLGAACVVALSVALIMIAAGSQPSLALDGIIYVDADADPGGGGTSWTDAYTNLQDALDAVVTTPVEIWVATGVYTPTSRINAEDPRSATFQMENGVEIYGGFAGGETERGQRDWEANPTILSGDLNGDDLPEFANREDNSYHVFYHPDGTGLDSTAILDGFTITGGNANGDDTFSSMGGGMLNWVSSPALSNCRFEGNSARATGGGMANESSSSPTLSNCAFYDNSAPSGGGMENWYYSSPVLINVTFSGNSAESGGGVRNRSYSSPMLTNCTFEGNSAGVVGGGMYNLQDSSPTLTGCAFLGNSANWGGGMANSDSSAPVLTDCIVSDNWADSSGGGIYNAESSPTLTNCTFQGNSAVDEGGGMLNISSAPTLTGCTFSGNTADAGGGMHNSSASPMLTNVTFAGNEASSGGGMHNNESSPVLVNCTFWGNSAQGKGGGIRNKTNSAPTLTNCTFYGNTATDGGALQNFESSSPTLTNCILWGDTAPEISNSTDSEADVTFSDVQGNAPDPIAGNISADPLFLDPDNGDFHLLPGSPCIDAGNNEAPGLSGIATDLDGKPRFSDVVSVPDTGNGAAPIVDMGAHEAIWHPVYLPLVLRGY